MSKPSQPLKSRDHAGALLPSTASVEHIQLPNGEGDSSEIARISDWLKLADRVLGENNPRKKA